MKIWNKIITNQFEKEKELIPQVANIVTANDCANVNLFLNTSPIVITFGDKEIKQILHKAKLVLLNIGTLQNSKIFKKTSAFAHKNHKLIILDPVGVGASNLRNNATKKIIDSGAVSVIRGNYSEITFLATKIITGQGVDSKSEDQNIIENVQKLALKYETVVAATGPVDYITDGKTVYQIKGNCPELMNLTGMGCSLSAAVASFVSKNTNILNATVAACAYFIECALEAMPLRGFEFKTKFFTLLENHKKITRNKLITILK